jgi:hypothetical protein
LGAQRLFSSGGEAASESLAQQRAAVEQRLLHQGIDVQGFSEENFGALIYDNWVFDVPMLIDMCTLYGAIRLLD